MTVTITIPDDIEKHLEFIPKEMLSDVLVGLVRKGVITQSNTFPSKPNNVEISTDTLTEALKAVFAECNIQTYAKVDNSSEKDFSGENIYKCNEVNENVNNEVITNEVITSSINDSDEDDDDDLDDFMDMMK